MRPQQISPALSHPRGAYRGTAGARCCERCGAAEDLASRPPSEFLERLTRAGIGELMGHSAALIQALQPRSVIAGPDGKVGAPQVNFPAEVLMTLARMERCQAITLDLLLSFLAGRAELRPLKAASPENGGEPKA